jgi:hypothetical protein
MDDTTLITRNYMLYFLLPLWIVPGVADYLCHRRTKIETTTGVHESVIHLIMMTEVGIPVVLGLLLEINALVILLMIFAFFIHEATAFWDVSYAVTRRNVAPVEQHVHSFLEVLPFMAASFVICLHWRQFLALVGAGTEPARFVLQLKEPPLSMPYVVAILAAIAVFLGLPYAEEFLRCYRAARRHGTPATKSAAN